MARMRSPNFPGLSLEDAIKAAGEIFDKNRQAIIDREVAAKDIGYTGLTGRSLKVLGSMNQYDLIENVSKGQVRVTKTAADILHGYPESVKLDALRRAGQAPALFQGIYDRFDGHIPSDNAIRSYLVQSGFTNEGVEKALRAFTATNRFLEIKGAFESHGNDDIEDPESPPVEKKQEREPIEPEMPILDKAGIGRAVFWNKGELDFNLSSAGLAVTGATNSASELRAFIAKLEALAPLLPGAKTEL